jgi:hypothetical protein
MPPIDDTLTTLPPRACIDPAPGHRSGVFAEGGGVIHVALLEAHTFTVFEIDRRNQQHGRVEQLMNKGTLVDSR